MIVDMFKMPVYFDLASSYIEQDRIVNITQMKIY